MYMKIIKNHFLLFFLRTFLKKVLKNLQKLLKKLLLMLLLQRLFHADSSVHMGPLPHMLDADICFASERVAKDVDPYRSLFFFP